MEDIFSGRNFFQTLLLDFSFGTNVIQTRKSNKKKFTFSTFMFKVVAVLNKKDLLSKGCTKSKKLVSLPLFQSLAL